MYSKLLLAIKNLDFNTESFVDGIESGNYRSKFIGGGMEFSEVREYVYGDDVKKIDWNVEIKKKINYNSKTNIEDGINNFVNWYKSFYKK